MLDAYTPGSEVVLKKLRRLLEHGRRRHLQTVDISITPDAVTSQQMLTSGEVDYATNIPLENVDSVAEVHRGLRGAGLQLAVQLRRPVQHHRGRRSTTRGAPGAELRDALRRHHRRRRAGLRHAEPRPPCRRGSSRTRRTCRCTSRTSTRRATCWPTRATTGRLRPSAHLRLRERGRGPLRAADQGRLRARSASTSRCAASCSTSSGRRPRPTRPTRRTSSSCTTGRPTATRAPTTCGRCSTPARRRSST